MFNMNCETINNYLEKYNVPLQNLAHKYNTPLPIILEITELYLLINTTWDTLHLYYHLDFYDNDELKNAISEFVCDTL